MKDLSYGNGNAKAHPDVGWFGYNEREDDSTVLGLFLGAVAAVENDINREWGRATIITAADGRRVREFYHIDDNLLPVIEWDKHESNVSFVAQTVAQWMEKQKSTKLIESYKEFYETKARNEENVKEPGSSDEDEVDRAAYNGRRHDNNNTTATKKDKNENTNMQDDSKAKKNSFVILEPKLTYCDMASRLSQLELRLVMTIIAKNVVDAERMLKKKKTNAINDLNSNNEYDNDGYNSLPDNVYNVKYYQTYLDRVEVCLRS